MTAPRVVGSNPSDPWPVVNEALDILAHQEVYGIDPDTTATLTWGYLGGRWGGFAISDGTLALTDAAENYIVVERATGAISVATNTTNWNDGPGYARVFHLTTAGGVVTLIRDYRGGPGGVHGQVSGGAVFGPGSSTDNALARFSGTDGDLIQNSGVIVSDNDEISGYKGHINRQTGTSYTLTAGDSGKIVEITNASAITLDMPNSLPEGWCCTVVQGGAGAITFTPASGANRRNRQAHTKTAGQWAMCSLYIRTNSGGNTAEYVLGGDTAA